MILISCENCGCVVDTRRIVEPRTFDRETGERIKATSVYYYGEYVPIIECPCCKGKIVYKNGDSV